MQNFTDLDGLGLLDIAASPPAFSVAAPDENIATLYQRDGLGRTVLVTQTGILTGTFDPLTEQFSGHTTRATRTEYDLLGRPVTTTLNYVAGQPIYDPALNTGQPDVNVQTITSYDAAGNVVGSRDALHRWSVTEYDALGRAITTTLNYENGNPLTIDPGNTGWATLGDTDITQVTVYGAGGQLYHTIQNYVDGDFTVTEPLTDIITLYEYDQMGRGVTTTLNYDDSLPSGHPELNRVTLTHYDDLGRASAQRDVLGRWTVQGYDAVGRQYSTFSNCVDPSTDLPTPVWEDCASSSPTAAVDANIERWTAYDDLGRGYRSSTDRADPIVSQSEFDALGRSVRSIQNYGDGVYAPQTATDEDVTTSQTYDALGRTLTSTDAEGGVTSYAYDGLGATVVITDADGRVTRSSSGAGQHWTARRDSSGSWRYSVTLVDGLGRSVATVENYQNGAVSGGEATDQDRIARTTYDGAGRTLTTEAPDGQITAFGYNLRDQLTSVTENQLNSGCTIDRTDCNVTTSYGYDRAGNRISITDARLNTRMFVFNTVGEEVQRTDALSQVTGYSYDAGGRRIGIDDPRGSTYDVTYTYDGLDRLTSITSAGLSSPITFTYTLRGQRATMIDASGTTSYAYDDLSRTTAITDGNSAVVGYAYDGRSLRTGLIYPDASSVLYGYTAGGQLQAITQSGTLLASYSYDAAGLPSTLLRTNVATTTWDYDALGQLTDLATTRISDSALLSAFRYGLNRAGQRTTLTETLELTSRVLSYDYDGLDRLIAAATAGSTVYTYTYDLVGNRTQSWTDGVQAGSWSYNAADQLSNLGWDYDEAGNLLTDGSQSYAYDALGRLTSTTVGLQTTNHSYNGDGILLASTTGSNATSYAQDQVSSLSQILEQDDVTTTSYLYGLQRLSSLTGSTRTWELHDGLGSVRQTLDTDGTILDSLTFDPWGQPESGTPTLFGFTGELQDTTTGLVHLRARWYYPKNGQFISRDPIDGLVTTPYSQHSYQYAYSRPTVLVDPTGMFVQPHDTLITNQEVTPDVQPISDRINNDVCLDKIDAVMNNHGFPPEDNVDPRIFASVLKNEYNIEVTDLHLWTTYELWVIEESILSIREREYPTWPAYTFRVITGSLNQSMRLVRTIASGNATYNDNTHTMIAYNGAFYDLHGFRRPRMNSVETFSHEFGHAWDKASDFRMSDRFMEFTGGHYICEGGKVGDQCNCGKGHPRSGCTYITGPGWPRQKPATAPNKPEDWGYSFGGYVSERRMQELNEKRKRFIKGWLETCAYITNIEHCIDI